jgi:hypothetical protein
LPKRVEQSTRDDESTAYDDGQAWRRSEDGHVDDPRRQEEQADV